jgi:hypothetical protein
MLTQETILVELVRPTGPAQVWLLVPDVVAEFGFIDVGNGERIACMPGGTHASEPYALDHSRDPTRWCISRFASALTSRFKTKIEKPRR